MGALWIDVEGYQKQVLQGARDYLGNPKLLLIKIELENVEFFSGQSLSEEIDAELRRFGFEPVFFDFEYTFQFNVIYVRRSSLDLIAPQVAASMGAVMSISLPLSYLIRKHAPAMVKRMMIRILGPAVGHKLASLLGSKSSRNYGKGA